MKDKREEKIVKKCKNGNYIYNKEYNINEFYVHIKKNY